MINRKHRYIAHEVFLTSFRLGLRWIIIPFVIAIILYCLIIFFVSARKVSEITSIKIPYSNNLISKSMVLNYFVDFSFGLGKNMMLPEELSPVVEKAGIFSHVSDGRIKRSLYKVVIETITQNKIKELKPSILKTCKIALLIFIFPVIYILFFWRNKSFYEPEFVRGAKITDINDFKEKLNRSADKSIEKNRQKLADFLKVNPSSINKENLNLQICKDVFLPRSSECKHVLCLGSIGSGKSVLLNQLMSQIIKRQKIVNQKFLTYDVKGEFLSKHRQDKDIVFYPFDKRSIRWSLFNEIQNYPDLDIVSSSIFQPPPDSRDEYWYNSAKDVFRSGLLVLNILKKKTNRDIVNFFNQQIKKIKQDFLDLLPTEEQGAVKHIDKSDSPQSASIISILQEKIQFLRYIIEWDGDFSFRDWVRDEKDKRNVFLLNIKENEMIFRPLMTFIVDTCIREVLTLSDYPQIDLPRITFVIDEFGSLSKLMSIFDFLTLSRSKGGSLILANQDLGSVTSVYGEANKGTFTNNFNTFVILRLNDPVTAKYFSDAMGEQESIKKSDSHQMSPADMGDRFSISSQEKIDKVILPSELMQLKDFQAFLKISGKGISQIKIDNQFFPEKIPGYDPRTFGIDFVLKNLRSMPNVHGNNTDPEDEDHRKKLIALKFASKNLFKNETKNDVSADEEIFLK